MKPTKTEFDLGLNCHRQPVRLVHERTPGGSCSWTLYRDQESQRDDSSIIRGITDAQIAAMAEAVKAVR